MSSPDPLDTYCSQGEEEREDEGSSLAEQGQGSKSMPGREEAEPQRRNTDHGTQSAQNVLPSDPAQQGGSHDNIDPGSSLLQSASTGLQQQGSSHVSGIHYPLMGGQALLTQTSYPQPQANPHATMQQLIPAPPTWNVDDPQHWVLVGTTLVFDTSWVAIFRQHLNSYARGDPNHVAAAIKLARVISAQMNLWWTEARGNWPDIPASEGWLDLMAVPRGVLTVIEDEMPDDLRADEDGE